MKLIDADAYAEEMKKRQDACKEWTQRTIDTGDEENYLRSCGAYVVFVEAKLLLEKQPTINAVESKNTIVIPHRNYKGYNIYWCDCGWFLKNKDRTPNYCPKCGKRIEWGDVE